MLQSSFAGIYDQKKHIHFVNQHATTSIRNLEAYGASGTHDTPGQADIGSDAREYQALLNEAREFVSIELIKSVDCKLDAKVASKVLDKLSRVDRWKTYLQHVGITASTNRQEPISKLFLLEHVADQLDRRATAARATILNTADPSAGETTKNIATHMRRVVRKNADAYRKMTLFLKEDADPIIPPDASGKDLSLFKNFSLRSKIKRLWENEIFAELLKNVNFVPPTGEISDDLALQTYYQILEFEELCRVPAPETLRTRLRLHTSQGGPEKPTGEKNSLLRRQQRNIAPLDSKNTSARNGGHSVAPLGTGNIPLDNSPAKSKHAGTHGPATTHEAQQPLKAQTLTFSNDSNVDAVRGNHSAPLHSEIELCKTFRGDINEAMLQSWVKGGLEDHPFNYLESTLTTFTCKPEIINLFGRAGIAIPSHGFTAIEADAAMTELRVYEESLQERRDALGAQWETNRPGSVPRLNSNLQADMRNSAAVKQRAGC